MWAINVKIKKGDCKRSTGTIPRPSNTTMDTQAAPPPGPRCTYWDNIRFVLIVLVVIGHLCAYLQPQYPWLEPFNTVLQVFRMPLMAFIAGTFAHADPRPGSLERRIASLLLPYVLLQALLGWYYTRVLETQVTFSMLRPVHTLWFLLALFYWHLCLPWITRWRHPVALAVVIALLAGCVDGIGQKWSLSRAVVFFPFFVLGNRLAWRDRAAPIPWSKPMALGVVLCIGLLLAVVMDHRVVLELAMGTDAYADLTRTPPLWGPVARLLVMCAALVLGAAFLSLVPARRFWWTRLGEQTLYIYVFHGVVLRTLNETGVFSDIPAALLLPVLLLLPLLLAWSLAWRGVARATAWAVQGRAWWSLKALCQRPRAGH